MIRFLEDLFSSGNIQSQADLPLDILGSREFIQKFLDNIAFRKGIGYLLAEGSARVADQIENGWSSCSKYFPAHGSAEHESLRNNPGVALLWALDSRDPIIDQHPYARISSTFQKREITSSFYVFWSLNLKQFMCAKQRSGKITTFLHRLVLVF